MKHASFLMALCFFLGTNESSQLTPKRYTLKQLQGLWRSISQDEPAFLIENGYFYYREIPDKYRLVLSSRYLITIDKTNHRDTSMIRYLNKDTLLLSDVDNPSLFFEETTTIDTFLRVREFVYKAKKKTFVKKRIGK